MPALVYHRESFGSPVQWVRKVELEERVLPRWTSQAEMPPAPEVELVFEPVEEYEASEEQRIAEGDVIFATREDSNPASSYPVCAVGQRTRARVARSGSAAVPEQASVSAASASVGPAAPEASSKPGGPSRSARVVGDLDPRYPERQRAAGRSATVLLLVHIDENGRPSEVEPLNDDIHPDFIRAAVSAARKARYEPALAEGRPVACAIRVRVQFQLQ